MNIHNEIVTSRQNPLVKWICSLDSAKERRENGCFFVEGVKLIGEALKLGLPVSKIIFLAEKKKELTDFFAPFFEDERFGKTDVYFVSSEVFSKITTEKAPQGVICVIKNLDFFRRLDIINKDEISQLKSERLLGLYAVRDPANLGAVIRSAAAFGVTTVVLSSDCADVYNPKTVRASMGSLFHINVLTVDDFCDFVTALRENGRRVFCAELRPGAKSLSDVPLQKSDMMIIGNEGHGIDISVSSVCDGSIYLPISSEIESLNASVAASIFMWEQNKL